MSGGKDSSQKFLSRNRPPRVDIQFEVEDFGAQKMKTIPFVMGVMSDLAGHRDDLPPIRDRKFLEVDIDNFTQRMTALNPTLNFRVKNTLTGEGELSVSLDFKTMDDFKPDQVAQRVPELATLFRARQRLANLLAYMDGKTDAEQWLNDILSQPDALERLAAEAPEGKPENASTDTETA